MRLLLLAFCFMGCTYADASMRIGNTYHYLDAWGGQDYTTEPLVVTQENNGAARFYSRATQGYVITLSSAARVDNGHSGVGAILYGEVGQGQAGVAWGANPVAATYSPDGNAVGEEVNGINRSGSSVPIVYGQNIVMGGNAPTDTALMIETSGAEPLGKAEVGIQIGHQGAPAASQVGLKIGEVDSGIAMQIQDCHRIVLNTAGTIYLQACENKVQLVKDGIVVVEW